MYDPGTWQLDSRQIFECHAAADQLAVVDDVLGSTVLSDDDDPFAGTVRQRGAPPEVGTAGVNVIVTQLSYVPVAGFTFVVFGVTLEEAHDAVPVPPVQVMSVAELQTGVGGGTLLYA